MKKKLSFNKKLLTVTLACAFCTPQLMALTLDDIITDTSLRAQYEKFKVENLNDQGTEKFNSPEYNIMNSWYTDLKPKETTTTVDFSKFENRDVILAEGSTDTDSLLSIQKPGVLTFANANTLTFLSTIHAGPYPSDLEVPAPLNNFLKGNSNPHQPNQKVPANYVFNINTPSLFTLNLDTPNYFFVQSFDPDDENYKALCVHIINSSGNALINIKNSDMVFQQNLHDHIKGPDIDPERYYHSWDKTNTGVHLFNNDVSTKNELNIQNLKLFADADSFVGINAENKENAESQIIRFKGNNAFHFINTLTSSGIHISDGNNIESVPNSTLLIDIQPTLRESTSLKNVLSNSVFGIYLEQSKNNPTEISLKGDTKIHIKGIKPDGYQKDSQVIHEFYTGVFFQDKKQSEQTTTATFNKLDIDLEPIGLNHKKFSDVKVESTIQQYATRIYGLLLDTKTTTNLKVDNATLTLSPQSVIYGQNIGIYTQFENNVVNLTFNDLIIKAKNLIKSTNADIRDEGDAPELSWQTGVSARYVSATPDTIQNRFNMTINGKFATDAQIYGINMGGYLLRKETSSQNEQLKKDEYRYNVELNGDVDIQNAFTALATFNRSKITINKNANPNEIVIKGRIANLDGFVDIILAKKTKDSSYLFYSPLWTGNWLPTSGGTTRLTLKNGAVARVGQERNLNYRQQPLVTSIFNVENGELIIDNTQTGLPHLTQALIKDVKAKTIASTPDFSFNQLTLEKAGNLTIIIPQVIDQLSFQYWQDNDDTPGTFNFYYNRTSKTPVNPSFNEVTSNDGTLNLEVAKNSSSWHPYLEISSRENNPGFIKGHLNLHLQLPRDYDIFKDASLTELKDKLQNTIVLKVSKKSKQDEFTGLTPIVDPVLANKGITNDRGTLILSPTKYLTYGIKTQETKSTNDWIIGEDIAEGDYESAPTPAVESNAVLPQIGLENLYQMRDTLYQRLGDVSLSNTGHNGAWVRLTGLHAELKDNFGFKSDGQRFEFGLDHTFDRVAQGRVIVGASVLALQSKNDINLGQFKDRTLAGSLYATYLNDNGWYVDTVGRFGRTKAYDFNVAQKGSDIGIAGDQANQMLEGHIANTSASVTTLSLEAGKRFTLQHHFYVKPQAQLQYGHLGTRHGQYAIGDFKYDVTWDAMNSLLGRAGLELGWDWSDAARHPGSVHIVGNVLREMSAKGKLYMHNSALDNANDDASLTRDYKRTWYTLGLGANVKLNNAWLLHGNVERTFKGIYNDLWRVDLGVRYQF